MFIQFADALEAKPGSDCDLSAIAIERSGAAKQGERERIEKQLEQIRSSKDQLIQWRQDGSLQRDEWHRRMEGERAREQPLLGQLDAVIARADTDASLIQELTGRLLQSPGEVWKSLPVELRRQLQDALFPEGVVFEEGKLRTHAINPIFNGFGEPFMQVRTLAVASGAKLELGGRPWHRRARNEREHLVEQYLGRETDVGVAPPPGATVQVEALLVGA